MKRFQRIHAQRIVANGVASMAMAAAVLLAGCGNSSESGPTPRRSGTADTGSSISERTALVIVKDTSAPPTTRCIEFTDSARAGQASGIDILSLSNLDLAYETAAGSGVLVCRIDSAGCDFPAEGCLCQCESGDSCRFWSYWQRAPGGGGWQRSERGGGGSIAQAGGVEGWVFGAGESPPPDLSFSEICS